MSSNADFFGDELLTISRNIARSGFHMSSVGFGRCSVPGCDCPPSPMFRVERVADAWLARDPNRMAMWLNHYQVGRSKLALPSVSQLVFSDGNGRFPDDPDCEESLRASQQRLAADPLNFPPPANRAARRRAGRHLRSIR